MLKYYSSWWKTNGIPQTSRQAQPWLHAWGARARPAPAEQALRGFHELHAPSSRRQRANMRLNKDESNLTTYYYSHGLCVMPWAPDRQTASPPQSSVFSRDWAQMETHTHTHTHTHTAAHIVMQSMLFLPHLLFHFHFWRINHLSRDICYWFCIILALKIQVVYNSISNQPQQFCCLNQNSLNLVFLLWLLKITLIV